MRPPKLRTGFEKNDTARQSMNPPFGEGSEKGKKVGVCLSR
jgi:hypothetical protein